VLLVALQRRLADGRRSERHRPAAAETAGYMSQVQICSCLTPLPSQGGRQGVAAPHDLAARKQVYSAFDQLNATITTPMVVAGGLQCILEGRRSRIRKEAAADVAHRSFPATTQPDAAGRRGDAQGIHIRKANEQHCSRIDDILLNMPKQDGCCTSTILHGWQDV
jgi:hypothetical protein